MESAMHLIKRKPEETVKKENVFNGIEEMPRWRWWLEIAGYTAALLVIGDSLMRLLLLLW
jgi:hypothetical protein